MIEFDASELARLEVAIGKQEVKAAAGMYAVAKRAAVNVKNGMADQTRTHPHFAQMAGSVSYDIYPAGLRTVGVTVGPDKDLPAGALGNIFWFGTSRDAPVEDIDKPLRDEQPRIQRALLDLGDF